MTRLIAAKVVLAARVDTHHQSPDGSAGESMLEEINKKLDKMQVTNTVKSTAMIF